MATPSTSQSKPLVPRGTNHPAPPAGPAITIEGDVGPLANLVTFSIRNGDVSSAKSLLVKATLSRMWHWCPIANLPFTHAIRNTAAYIKIALAQVTANRPADMSDEVARKIALVLGVARAVITELCEVSDSDLIPGEREDPMMIGTVQQDGTTTFALVQNLRPEYAAVLGRPLEITDQERAAIASIHMSAIGIPPVQGYSLLMTNHHYLSDAKGQSRRAFDVIERAYWESTSVKTWWDAHTDIMRDALWHKVGHPLVITFKMTLAQSPSIKEMLIAAGCGPAASRLPAVESEVRAANSYITLLKTVRPMYEYMGGETNYKAIEEALATVPLFPPGVAVQSVALMDTVPDFVVDRKTALLHLANTCNANNDLVANAYGFYCAMHERTTAIGGGNKTDTLIEANSLKKLENQSSAAYTMGREHYGDYVAKKNQDRAAGKFGKIDLVLGSVGDHGVELHAEEVLGAKK